MLQSFHTYPLISCMCWGALVRDRHKKFPHLPVHFMHVLRQTNQVEAHDEAQHSQNQSDSQRAHVGRRRARIWPAYLECKQRFCLWAPRRAHIRNITYLRNIRMLHLKPFQRLIYYCAFSFCQGKRRIVNKRMDWPKTIFYQSCTSEWTANRLTNRR